MDIAICVPCASGRFSSVVGATSSSQCNMCRSGKFSGPGWLMIGRERSRMSGEMAFFFSWPLLGRGVEQAAAAAIVFGDDGDDVTGL